MTRFMVGLGFALAAAGGITVAEAQEVDIRAQLVARGAPSDFADRVAEIVAAARQRGLPSDPIVDKALEGWAKRSQVPPDRLVAVLEGLSTRLERAREATRGVLTSPPDAVVVGAAEALGRGLTAEDVRQVITAAPTPEGAAVGLTVAAALAAQGLEITAAIRAVADVYAAGHPPERALELPSGLAEMLGQGVPLPDIARQILQGGALPLPGLGGVAGRPAAVPPARGPATDIPAPRRPPLP